MPIQKDFSMVRYSDGLLNFSLESPTAIGGWQLQFSIHHRFGGTSGPPLIVKNMASGFVGVSGMNIIDSGQGKFNVTINSADMSGLSFKNYSYAAERLDSGFRTTLAEGYLNLKPSIG